MIAHCEVRVRRPFGDPEPYRDVACGAHLPCTRHDHPGALFDAETLRIAGVAPDLIPTMLGWDRAVLMRLAVRVALQTAAGGTA